MAMIFVSVSESGVGKVLGVAVLLGLGLGLDAFVYGVNPSQTITYRLAHPDPVQMILLMGAIVVVAVAPLRRGSVRVMEWVDRWPRRWVAVGLFVGAFIHLYASTILQQPYLPPKLHDEQSYRLATIQLAAGKLAMPRLPAAESFESFHIFTQPVYASMYPPGTAMMHVPGVWLGVPGWVVSVFYASVAVSLLFVMLCRLLNRGVFVGIMGAVLLLAAPQFRTHAGLIMAEVPTLLWGMGLILAAVCFRERPGVIRVGWMGVCLGMMGLTRPQDAVCFVVPAVLIAFAKYGQLSWGKRIRYALMGMGAMLPFVVLMGVQNIQVTGSLFDTAYAKYARTMLPGMGFSVPLSGVGGVQPGPETSLQQKVDYFRFFAGHHEWIARQSDWIQMVRYRLGEALNSAFPSPHLLVFLPLGIVGVILRVRRIGGVLLLPLLGYVMVYGLYTFAIGHYVIPYIPMLIGFMVMVPFVLEEMLTFGSGYGRVGGVWVIWAFVIAGIPLLNPMAKDDLITSVSLQEIRSAEAKVSKPALILFRYRTGDDLHAEPVYNLESPYLAKNQILHAHDLGSAQNVVLFKAMAGLGPDREVYLYDRRNKVLIPLGSVNELALN